MKHNINQALILAAGYGKRMGEMTEKVPKPMIEINEKTLIERLILNLLDSGIKRILINSHYMSEILSNHINFISEKYKLREKLSITIIYEPDLLETGGTIKKNLNFFANNPFFAISSDIIWSNFRSNLDRLYDKFLAYPESQIILSVTEKENIRGLEREEGDFILQDDKLFLSPKKDMIYTGMQLINKVDFSDHKSEYFPINNLYFDLSKRDKLYGVKFLGEIFHVGDIKAFYEAEKYFKLARNNY